MAASGVRSDRLLLHWASAERTRGSFDWRATDELVGGLASRGIRPVPFVWGSPGWTRSGGFAKPPVSASAQQEWGRFLKVAVTRYEPGGVYWANRYRQQFGAAATPLPITSWQIWNEPNLRAEFYPGSTVGQAAKRYAELLAIAHDAIKAVDPAARIVLAGIATQKDPYAFEFLDHLYASSGAKGDFDAAAQHPYAGSLDKVRSAIQRFRGVMADHGDRATPLWITEIGWGSAPPDGEGINLGPDGQAQMLHDSFGLILDHRSAWNVQRVFWFHWRDPAPGAPFANVCKRCASAGLLTYSRAPKPALTAYTDLAAETTPPAATITGGPGEGGLARDSTPTFSFASTEAGSTFACATDGGPLKTCATPQATSVLSDGPHTFSLEAIDAAGNESPVVSRSFRVDAPPAPKITATSPFPPANNNTPRLKGSAEAGSTVRIYSTAGCEGPAVAHGSAASFASPGLAVTVADDSQTAFRATATDAAGNTSECSTARTYIEDSTPPQTTITAGPSGSTADDTPTFSFASSESSSTFGCRFDSQPFSACSGPGHTDTPSTPLSPGPHTFSVRATDKAQNTDYTAARRSFTVTP
jgi:Glycosyl hydrolase catalytic core